MNIIDELTEYFRKFPGVGPRQASRFVYYLLRTSREKNSRIAELIKNLKSEISQCSFCNHTYIKRNSVDNGICDICSNINTDKTKIFIIENDTDLETINSSGVFNGRYFIIGSLVKILDKDFHDKVFLNKLVETIKLHGEITEIIFGLDATPDGENTISIFKKEIAEKAGREIRVTVLGRGLSTGSEIEYIDKETLRNALEGRH